jgi:hypothetical protein
MTKTISRTQAEEALATLADAKAGLSNALAAKGASMPEHERDAALAALGERARRRTEVDHDSGSYVVYLDGVEFLRVTIDELTQTPSGVYESVSC